MNRQSEYRGIPGTVLTLSVQSRSSPGGGTEEETGDVIGPSTDVPGRSLDHRPHDLSPFMRVTLHTERPRLGETVDRPTLGGRENTAVIVKKVGRGL